ncbi:MFS transporter [Montanilutibacter psychrotolerans]|uniref:MFS transporter n=1 Tax=Montanilutibacter psychrotolerans TaxID=1327343 RepID=A0A3M8SS87_9GAMM|nr:MFS transporter [Lysobacter psychrotolerans]RNF82346.1 MFS transporter [Lysobacter psychrotolerans]
MSRAPGLRDFLLIWAGQLISGVGSRLTSFALGLWVYRTTGSETRFALVFIAMALPALLVSPLAGALVDRWDRRRTMIACEVASATVMVALAILFATDTLAMWHVYAGVGISALANAFLQPAYAASIPLLASQDQLNRVNGMVQTGNAVALVGGPALAGVLMGVFSMTTVLLVDALTFAVGVVALVAARVPRPARTTPSEEANLWHEAATGFRYVRDRPGLLGVLTVLGLSNFFFGIASIAITPLVLSVSGDSETMLGLQMSIGCSGLLVGGLIMTLWGGPRSRIRCMLGFSLLAGVFLALHGLAPSFTLICAAGFALFLTMPFTNSANAALWQSKVPADLQGRCFAIQRVLSEAAMPLGYCLAGPLAEHTFEPLLAPGGALAGSLGLLIGTGPGRGLGLMFIVLGVLMVLVAVGAYAVRSIRRVESELPDAPPLVADTGTPLQCAT